MSAILKATENRITGVVLAIFFGTISYEIFIANFGDHFGLIVDHTLDILNGTAHIYAFQQRILPSAIISYLSQNPQIIQNTTYKYFKIHFILQSLLVYFIFLRNHTTRDSLLYSLLFSIANIYVLVAGFWYEPFDATTQLLTLSTVYVLISDYHNKTKIALFSIIFLAWQFVFEEAVYLPIIIFFTTNFDEIKSNKVLKIFKRKHNYLLGAICLISLAITNITRGALHHGQGQHGNHEILGQWFTFPENISEIFKQTISTIQIGNTLETNSWMQGAGIFIILNIVAALFAKSPKNSTPHLFSITATFFLASTITLLFARVQETNTLSPLLALLISIIATSKQKNPYIIENK